MIDFVLEGYLICNNQHLQPRPGRIRKFGGGFVRDVRIIGAASKEAAIEKLKAAGDITFEFGGRAIEGLTKWIEER